MVWCAFCVLMWKHAVVRKRYFLNTLLEFASPMLFAALIILLKSRLKAEVVKEPDYEEPPADPYPYTEILPLTEVTPAPYWILYYPDTILTNSLMEDVGAKLHLQKLDQFDKGRRNKGYFGTSNESLLNDVVSTLQYLEAVIIFQNMSGEVRPDRLNYTIRIRGDDEIESHILLGTMYDAFMRIQWAVDTSYIRLLSGVEVPQALSLQEFPFYRDLATDISIDWKLLMDLCCFSLMIPFLFLTSRLVQERTRGNQELMKIAGVSNCTQTMSHIFNVLPCGLVFSIVNTIPIVFVYNPLAPKSEPILVALTLMLYYSTTVSLAFACRYISRTGTGILMYNPLILAIPAYIVLYLPARYISGLSLMFPIMLATGVLPHVPMFWFWKELVTLQKKASGISFTNMMEPHAKTNGPVLFSICFMVLQSVVFHILTWYLSLVRPGQYAWALPKNFLFTTQYWCNRKPKLGKNKEDVRDERYQPYFQEVAEGIDLGIKIVNVSKVYQRRQILRNVSLDVPKGETLVLVGHRGAGKTALMTVIAGMTKATEGNIFVNGKDTVNQKREVRKILGICPQPDMLFYELTVEEHIIFFTLVTVNLAEKLSISNDLEDMIPQLSDEKKKRVQIAGALAGGVNVLVIDDPTSGFDMEDRKLLWDLISTLRGEYTVLLTSHFMEEANALGNRVATMHAGALNSSGNTEYLKNIVGTGYRLVCTTVEAPNEPEITKAVTKHIPDATVMEHTIDLLAYNLHTTPASMIPKLIAALESNKTELGLDTMKVSDLNIEEVYSRLCSGFGPTLPKDELEKPSKLEVRPKILRGTTLLKQQFFALLKRQIQFTSRNLLLFLILQVALPLLATITVTSIIADAPDPEWRWVSYNRRMSPQKPISPMNLDMFEDLSDRRVMYHIRVPDVNPAALKTKYPKVTFKESDDIANAVLRTGKVNILEYNKYLLGVEVNETDAKILYNTTARHAASVALNVLTNMLATRFIPWADGKIITTINNPIQVARDRSSHIIKDYKALFIYVQGISAIALLSILNTVTLPCKEREMGVRRIHKLTGCLPELYWCTTLTYHVAVCLVIPILPIVLTAFVMEEDHVINRPKTLAVMVLIMVLGYLAFLPLTYLLTFYLGRIMCCIIIVPFVVFFCSPLPILTLGNDYQNNLTQPMKTIKEVAGWAATPYTMESALLATMFVTRLNILCEHTKVHCDYVPFFIKKPLGFDYDKCCGVSGGEEKETVTEDYDEYDYKQRERKSVSGDMRCYFCVDEYSPGLAMIALAVQFLVCMSMVFIFERGVISNLAVNLLKIKYIPVEPTEEDKAVLAEKAYVKKAIKLPIKQIKDAVLVDNVHKNYVPLLFWRNINAVKGVSFFVKKGTCYGLLGEDGAGKTSICKMIVTEESATRGRLFACGYHLRRGNVRTMGYCPQNRGMDMFLTGEEHLALLMTLRGFRAATVKKEVESWMLIVDAQEFTRQPLQKYSPACSRRLCAAAAMCGVEELVVLDEPGAGSGGAARRKLWSGVQRVLRQNRTVIITGKTIKKRKRIEANDRLKDFRKIVNSTIQMETLCSRIGIIEDGLLVAVGTPAELRESHPPGYDVVFTISRQATETRDKYEFVSVPQAKRPCSCSGPRVPKAAEVRRIETPTPLKTFRKSFPLKFKYTLIEETKTSLFYHISEAIQFSDLYLKLEELQSEFPTVIEDYTVSAKTMEDVFFPHSKDRQTGPWMNP